MAITMQFQCVPVDSATDAMWSLVVQLSFGGSTVCQGEVMWSRSLLVQNLFVPKKAKPQDNDADRADAGR